MTQFLPPNLLALFAPRDAIPYKSPLGQLTWEKDRTKSPYLGIAQYVHLFENPKDTPPPTRGELKIEKKRRRIREKGEKRAVEIEDEVSAWDPHSDPNANSDAFKTLFVSRINYDTSESKLRREFETYGKIKKIHMVKNRATGRSRGYAFIEYDKERDMHAAYKSGDGKKIDGRRVLVDVERGRTVKGWRPRRLGGGLGSTRVHVEEGGNADNPMERDQSRDYDREREERSRVSDRSARDTREKRDIRRTDRDRGDRDRGDRDRGDRDRGDRDRGDRDRGDRDRGDRDRGDRDRGDKDRGDRDRGDRDRSGKDREKRKRDDREKDRGSDRRDRDRDRKRDDHKSSRNRDDDAGDVKKEERSRDKDRESRHRHRDRSREKDKDRRERRRDRDDKDRDRSGRDRESKHDSKPSVDVKAEEASATKENAYDMKQEDASGGYYGSSNASYGEGMKVESDNNGYQKGYEDNGYPQEGMDYQQNDTKPSYGKSTNYDEYQSSSMPSEDY